MRDLCRSDNTSSAKSGPVGRVDTILNQGERCRNADASRGKRLPEDIRKDECNKI
jgi:hypothetical protein